MNEMHHITDLQRAVVYRLQQITWQRNHWTTGVYTNTMSKLCEESRVRLFEEAERKGVINAWKLKETK